MALAVVEKARGAKAAGARRGALAIVVRSIVLMGCRVWMVWELGRGRMGWWLAGFMGAIRVGRVTSMA